MRKRNLKDVLFGITIGGLIFGGIGVAAITLTASEIKYTPSNSGFNATNAEEALDEIYKLTKYEIPADTYFYDSNTEGENIVRYKKVDGKYYLCDKNGKITSEEEQDVSSLTLVEYKLTSASDVLAGNAGFSNGNMYLGEGYSSSIESYSNIIYSFPISYAYTTEMVNAISYNKDYVDFAYIGSGYEGSHYMYTFKATVLKSGNYKIIVDKFITGGNQGMFSLKINGVEKMESLSGTRSLTIDDFFNIGDEITLSSGYHPDHSHRPHGVCYMYLK